MLVLNLLPPAEKEKLKQEEAHRWVGFYGSAILAVVFLFIFLLVIIWSYLLIQLDSVSTNLESARLSFKDQGFKKEENNIKEINAHLQAIDEAQKRQIYYSRLLAELSVITPPGIILNNIAVNEQKKGSLAGFAADREQIMAMKNNLEKSAYFKNINSPLSNIVRQKDIDFTFSFEINLDPLTDD